MQFKTFEAHLRFYKNYFHIISLDDYYNQRFSKERFNICITFDDGFANNYKYVLPLMNKYHIPVTFFITATRNAGYDILWNDFLVMAQKYGPSQFEFWNDQFYKDKHGRYISKQNGQSLRDLLQATDFYKKAELMRLSELKTSFEHKDEEDYWLQMTEDEIKMLSASPFVTIGCHGYYHNDLSRLSVNSAKDEMIGSKRYLENITGKEINALAFPYGNYSAEVVAAAKAVGFTRLLTTDFRFPKDQDDPTMRERLTINPYISINNQMISIINGRYI
ncbi:MAG TPA: polysaccharide deacetylase family protein [Parafilimonas sp.]|nr:polysaccharide deacetylase family protein [Parafilimonas sp.]